MVENSVVLSGKRMAVKRGWKWVEGRVAWWVEKMGSSEAVEMDGMMVSLQAVSLVVEMVMKTVSWWVAWSDVPSAAAMADMKASAWADSWVAR